MDKPGKYRIARYFALSLLGPILLGSCGDSATGLRDGQTAFSTVEQAQNRKPVPSIGSPKDSATFAVGSAVSFTGSATDEEDGAIPGTALEWKSNRDGSLGSGSSLTRSNLSVGQHAITLTARDSKGLSGGKEIHITILGPPENRKPVPAISSPAANATFAVGSLVSFAGSATDDEDGALPASALTWRSNRDGDLGAGSSLTRSNLSVGLHEIILTARDSKGATGTISIKVTIQSLPENREPVSTITSPASNATFAAGSMVTFTGSSNDAEDGPLPGTALEWKSSRDGSLGTGSTVTRSNLSAGVHEIVLVARDSKGRTGSSAVKITILGPPENQKPVASISSPAGEATLALGATVTFTGSATDEEDGALTGNSLSWRSGRDGDLGTGGSISRSNLSVGQHEITLTARDSKGATGGKTIKITIRADEQK